MSDNDLIQKGHLDLIRRGDALKALDWRDIYGRNAQDAINTVPAVQPTVSPELLATTNDVAALVEAIEQAKDFIDDQYACAESQAVQGEYVAKEARQLWYVLCAALARVKGETK